MDALQSRNEELTGRMQVAHGFLLYWKGGVAFHAVKLALISFLSFFLTERMEYIEHSAGHARVPAGVS